MRLEGFKGKGVPREKVRRRDKYPTETIRVSNRGYENLSYIRGCEIFQP